MVKYSQINFLFRSSLITIYILKTSHIIKTPDIDNLFQAFPHKVRVKDNFLVTLILVKTSQDPEIVLLNANLLPAGFIDHFYEFVLEEVLLMRGQVLFDLREEFFGFGENRVPAN
jgi:hypothetical protein